MNKNKQGIVVKIDGIDACGKTTLLNILLKYYEKNGYSVIKVQEFGANNDETVKSGECDLGLYEFFQEQAKSDNNDLDEVERELLWVIIGRRTNSRIIPNLTQDYDIVFVDRSNMGNIAYGTTVDTNLATVYDLLSTPIEKADLIIWLDTPTSLCMERLENTIKDRIEQRGFEYFKNVRTTYLELTKLNSLAYRIDGNFQKEDIALQAVELIDNCLKKANKNIN